MKNIISYLCVLLLVVSCADSQTLENKIVGIWKSIDGSVIELRDDNSVRISNYPLKWSNSDFKGLLNGGGSWKLYKDENLSRWVVELSITADRLLPELQSDGIAIVLLISNNGVLGNGEDISALFLWKGDPDSDNRYEFKKE